MNEKIQPALSDEEWAEALAWPDGTGEYVVRSAERLGYHNEPEDLHLVAALALHGQPFGFTWEDVDALRGMARAYRAEGGVLAIGLADHLDGLADRIVALLEPRELP
jgi:hypothetical protein